jgi:hypothetical protein
VKNSAAEKAEQLLLVVAREVETAGFGSPWRDRLRMALAQSSATVRLEVAMCLADKSFSEYMAEVTALVRKERLEAAEEHERRLASDEKYRRGEEVKAKAKARAAELAWDARHGAGSHAKLAKEREERQQALREEWLRKEAEKRAAHELEEEEWWANHRRSVEANMRELAETQRLAEVGRWATSVLEERFRLPSGEYVSWGEATADQHALMAGTLVDRAARTIETAARHDAAAAAIRASGESTLAAALKVKGVG